MLLLYVVFVAWLCFGYVLSDFGYRHPLNHHHLIPATITTTCTYNYHHKEPPRSASCSSTSALFASMVGRKTPQRVIPPCVQLKYLHQWLNEKAETAQVAMGKTTICTNGVFVQKVGVLRGRSSISTSRSRIQRNMHLKPTSSGSAQVLLECTHGTAIITTCIMAGLGRKLNCVPLLKLQ